MRETDWALGLELRQLRAFVMLVDAGNLSGAARVLGVAQSTMSESIAALERAIGTRLVVRRRGRRGIALTPAGEALLPHARHVFLSLEDAHVAVAQVDREIRARVEIIANESISTYILPAALAEVRHDWPKLRIAVTVGICPSISEGLSTARYDVGLMLQTIACAADDSIGEEERDSTRPGVTSLAEVPLVLFAVPGHPLASGTDRAPIPRSRLAAQTVFISDSRGHFFDLVRDFFRADAMPGPRLEATGSVESVKRGVLTDRLALGVLPGYAISEECRIGRLAPLRVLPDLPRVRLEATSYRTRFPAHPAVAALLDAVRRNVTRQTEFRTHREGSRRSAARV
jgi:DNA-binding transcriptional LysR family regulator